MTYSLSPKVAFHRGDLVETHKHMPDPQFTHTFLFFKQVLIKIFVKK
jgi:hypothetical protein